MLYTIENFPLNLAYEMEKKGVLAAHLAKFLNATDGLVSKYLSGDLKPSIDKFIQICQILEISPNDLLGPVHTKEWKTLTISQRR